MNIVTRRIYSPSSRADGFRMLCDRLWPRGLSRVKADVDYWAKDIAPSTALRQWFGHDVEKFAEFKCRYELELADNLSALEEVLKQVESQAVVTLLYASSEQRFNHTEVLAAFLRTRA